MRAPETNADDATTLALRALAWALDGPERARRLLDVTGLDPADLRARAGDPAVLAAAIDFLQAYQPDLIACAAAIGTDPGSAGRGARGVGMRPLLITDCDEVLLHMVRHFGDWLGEAHAIDFTIRSWELARNMKRRDGRPLETSELFGFLDGFFPAEMHRQTLVPHAREALAELAQVADIVVLTNLQDQCRTARIDQLAAFGIAHRVECNQGGKGGPVARLVAEYGNPVTVFVDDLPHHHDSVADHAPAVHRLHMVAEPALAPGVPAARAAHARIDDWREALPWITARFAAGTPADA